MQCLLPNYFTNYYKLECDNYAHLLLILNKYYFPPLFVISAFEEVEGKHI